MLNKLDDFPIHQTPEPIAHPATSDRNVYDRTWFNGYANDGSYYFGIGMAIYPHRGILDCAFSVVQPGGRQHCFYGSRRAPTERTEMQVGPFRMEVIEPMRRVRVVLEDNESGVSCDLVFSARTAAIQEQRQTLWNGPRRIMDATRFDQFGRWSGVVRHPDGEITVTEEMCHGTKDRSWGVRGVGEPETGGAPKAPNFERDIRSRVMIPAYARPAHRRLRQKLAEIEAWNESNFRRSASVAARSTMGNRCGKSGGGVELACCTSSSMLLSFQAWRTMAVSAVSRP